MATTVRFVGTREEARTIARSLGGILSGSSPDRHGIGQGFRNALGFLALSDIKQAYVQKADGGTDDMGIQWPPLAPSTIANRRVGTIRLPKVKAGLTNGALLSIAQKTLLKRDREKIRKRETKKALKRFRLSLPEKEAKRRAAIVGGLRATAETGKTKVETFGQRDVKILRDTGILLNSLTPGTLTGLSYAKPALEGGEKQTFDASAGVFAVGTIVDYAGVHQHGSSKKNIPARPFLPSDDNPVPAVWWERWLDGASKALTASVVVLFQGRP